MRGAMRDSMLCISTSRCDITNTLFAPRERSRGVFESRFSTLEEVREVESRVVIPSRVVSRDGTRVVTRRVVSTSSSFETAFGLLRMRTELEDARVERQIEP
jgi:hypothetical protein